MNDKINALLCDAKVLALQIDKVREMITEADTSLRIHKLRKAEQDLLNQYCETFEQIGKAVDYETL